MRGGAGDGDLGLTDGVEQGGFAKNAVAQIIANKLDGKDSIHPEFVFHEDGETLEEALIKVLITLYEELPEHYQLKIRNVLEEE